MISSNSILVRSMEALGRSILLMTGTISSPWSIAR